MAMYACQLWSKYTQTSMKHLRAAYKNATPKTHYIPRNVSVRPHQVSHCVRTFDALLRNNLYLFFIGCALLIFIQLFCSITSYVWCFSQTFIFPQLIVIQRSCMMETKCSSCSWIGSVFASYQYCFCVVKKRVGNVYTWIIQKEMLLKCFAPLNVGHVQNRFCNALLCG